MKQLKTINIPADSPLTLLARLPPNSFMLEEETISLCYPGDVAQQYVCPSCGPTSEIVLKKTVRHADCLSEAYMFKNGHYQHEDTDQEDTEEVSETYEVILCGECEQVIATEGEKVERTQLTTEKDERTQEAE